MLIIFDIVQDFLWRVLWSFLSLHNCWTFGIFYGWNFRSYSHLRYHADCFCHFCVWDRIERIRAGTVVASVLQPRTVSCTALLLTHSLSLHFEQSSFRPEHWAVIHRIRNICVVFWWNLLRLAIFHIMHSASLPRLFFHPAQLQWSTWWCSWLRHFATSWKVAGSIPDGVTGIFSLT